MLKFAVTRPVTNVVVFGCGGTGSRAVPLISQLLSSHEFTKNVKVILVDGDVVEEKNTKRQLFTQMDVGKNKAEVLAARYRKGFNAKTAAVPMFVPSVESQLKLLEDTSRGFSISRNKASSELAREAGDFYDSFFKVMVDSEETLSLDSKTWVTKAIADRALHTLFSNTTVFISCVDSADARRRLLQFIHNLQGMAQGCGQEACANSVVIDSGNEDLFGQVSYFSTAFYSLCPFKDLLDRVPDKAPFNMRIPYVPMPVQKYLDMKDAQTERSCADMDQTLAVNNMMAAMIMMVFQNLVYGLEMDYHTVYANMNGSFHAEKLSLKWLKGVLSTDHNYMRGIVDSLQEGAAGGFVPCLDSLNKARDAKFCDINEFLGMYFGIYHSSILDGTSFTRNVLKMGKAELVSSGGSPMSPSSIADYSSSLVGKHPLYVWTRSDASLTSWTEFVWPILAKAISLQFVHIDDVIRKYAYLTASTSIMGSTLENSPMRERVTAIVPHVVGYVPSPAGGQERYVLSRKTLLSIGDISVAEAESKKAVEKDMILNLHVKDSITGETIKILLPSTMGNVYCGVQQVIYTNRPDAQVSSTLRFSGPISSVVLNGILSSCSVKELTDLQGWFSNKPKVLSKGLRAVMGISRGLSPTIVSHLSDELTTHVSTCVRGFGRCGGTPILYTQLGEGISPSKSKESDTMIFGEPLNKSTLCISVAGRVYEEEEMAILSKKQVGPAIDKALKESA